MYIFQRKLQIHHVNFEIPKDEHIKWYLYELYRAQKKQQNKTGNGFKNTKSLIGKGKIDFRRSY